MKKVHILLVEDNEGDIVLTIEALKQAKLTNKIDIIKDGERAIQFLKKEGAYEQATTPDMILLDINLPKINGIEVLTYVKDHKTLRSIPVVMLTTSSAEKDVVASYANHANCYIAKPVGFENFMEVIHTLREFWTGIVQLPKRYDQ